MVGEEHSLLGLDDDQAFLVLLTSLVALHSQTPLLSYLLGPQTPIVRLDDCVLLAVDLESLRENVGRVFERVKDNLHLIRLDLPWSQTTISDGICAVCVYTLKLEERAQLFSPLISKIAALSTLPLPMRLIFTSGK